ncbi:lysoplasmalogenase [Nocardioides alcanivorans]|uniref:lysoplasmalogenase n=1 Tax=Nocardioides alcanivorans TaxID=2897352 RepID=UPI001F48AFA1|nr:lysoplasmalogenase [Nocardioides alcanivorans]
MSDRPSFSAPLFTFVAVSLVHLGAQLFGGDGLAAGTQLVLMPALAWLLLMRGTAAPARLVQWALIALFCSWLGDSLPRFATGDTAFLLMVGGFLLAQLCYAVAFWPHRDRSVLSRPLLVAPYVVGFVALLALLAPEAGSLLPAVLIYAVALVTMGVLSTGLGRLAGVGGLLFMLSDTLIAFSALRDWSLPGHGFWVMSTYLLAQLFLVVGVINARQSTTGRPSVSSRTQRP